MPRAASASHFFTVNMANYYFHLEPTSLRHDYGTVRLEWPPPTPGLVACSSLVARDGGFVDRGSERHLRTAPLADRCQSIVLDAGRSARRLSGRARVSPARQPGAAGGWLRHVVLGQRRPRGRDIDPLRSRCRGRGPQHSDLAGGGQPHGGHDPRAPATNGCPLAGIVAGGDLCRRHDLGGDHRPGGRLG